MVHGMWFDMESCGQFFPYQKFASLRCRRARFHWLVPLVKKTPSTNFVKHFFCSQ